MFVWQIVCACKESKTVNLFACVVEMPACGEYVKV